MNQQIVRAFGLALLSTAALSSQAASVMLNSWAFGTSWNRVSVSAPNHTGAAGGFRGSVSFSGTENGFNGSLDDFVTYCVEIDEGFGFSAVPMTNYSVVAGAAYGKWDNANNTGNLAANTAMRLGQLLSYVDGTAGAVDSSAESTALQLAIWNVIYDTDSTVTAGSFMEKSRSAYNAYADTLLLNSATWRGTLDVFVLSRPGKQDFVLTREARPLVPNSLQRSNVPEPASLALVAAALAAAGAASRRRRRRS